jgi:hypothetical protein
MDDVSQYVLPFPQSFQALYLSSGPVLSTRRGMHL